jgi:hypothetical protein
LLEITPPGIDRKGDQNTDDDQEEFSQIMPEPAEKNGKGTAKIIPYSLPALDYGARIAGLPDSSPDGYLPVPACLMPRELRA